MAEGVNKNRKYHLFDEPSKRFLMKPDIVISDKIQKQVFIMDTKWKVLSDSKANYGISQADMYHMYAYQKKYSSENVTMIYPMTDKVENKEIQYQSKDGVNVKICFVDLYCINESLEKLIEVMSKDYL